MPDLETGAAAPEQSLEQQLESFFTEGEKSPEAAPPASPADAALPSPEATSTSGEVSPPANGETPAEPTLEEQLATIEEPPAAEAAKPALSEEQQQVLTIVPNVAALQSLNQAATQLQQVNEALSTRNFDAFEKMLDPAALADFEDYLYQKKVASGDWVDRWIKEKEAGPLNPQLKTMERQLAQLQAQLAGRQTAEQAAQAEARRTQLAQQYTTHLTGLFEQIKFAESDRRWVMADINNRVGSDPKVGAALRSGNMAAVNSIFKAAVKDYVQRDQQVTTAQQATLKKQEQHKPPLQTAPVTESAGITDEQIAAAPREQRATLREQKLDQELTALFKGKK